MKERQIVVLLGDSLLMDSVEASLGENPALGVVRMHTTIADTGECLKALGPDVVIFDVDTSLAELLLSFLRDQPGIPVLGLDISCSHVLALSSQKYTTPTARDLAQVIQMQVSHGVRERERSFMALDEQVKELLQRWL